MEWTNCIRGVHAGKRKRGDSPLPGVPRTPEQPKNKLPKTTNAPSAFRSKKGNKRASSLILREDVGTESFTQLWRTLCQSGRQFHFVRSPNAALPGADYIYLFTADLVRLAIDGNRILNLVDEVSTEEEEGEDDRNQTNDRTRRN